MKCNICGAEFIPTKENHYTAFVERVGYSSPFVINAHIAEKKVVLIDCFDCPSCGCQVEAKDRKFTYDPEIIVGDAPQLHSAYFKSEAEAAKFLKRLQKKLSKNGFVSYWDYKSILNRPPKWEYGFGWTNLDNARVEQNDNGWYLAMPALTNKQNTV